MVYSDFNWKILRDQLGLEYHEVHGTFDSCPPISVSKFLQTTLGRGLSVALGKARSEMLVAPVLLEIKALLTEADMTEYHISQVEKVLGILV